MKKLKRWIEESEYLVFFGGAGVSTESGIPDFRSETGIYQTKTMYGYPPEQIISRSFFQQDPRTFFDFYRATMIRNDAGPNDAHKALARLEQEGCLKAVITQNIDGLHQKAGSRNVYEIHGSVHRNYCMVCGKSYGADYIMGGSGVPYCEVCGSIVKPDVVLYEEPLDDKLIANSIMAIRRADMLIVGGTSLNVYPAAGFLKHYEGDRLVLINQEPTALDQRADMVVRGRIGEVLGTCVLTE